MKAALKTGDVVVCRNEDKILEEPKLPCILKMKAATLTNSFVFFW